MYRVLANINAVDNRSTAFGTNLKLAILDAVDDNTKMIFCATNNPTGNSFSDESVVALLQNFKGFVVIDEAYIDFPRNKAG
jgi:histidinol-phosphate aminotransferase